MTSKLSRRGSIPTFRKTGFTELPEMAMIQQTATDQVMSAIREVSDASVELAAAE